jgi:polysaccharide deacetylase family protein (PEP-CTERM system associated)
VAEREPALVREIVAAGHEIACHGYGHILPLQLSREEFRQDVLRARDVLRETAGVEPAGYRAPSFNLDRDRLDILEDCGFRYDSSHHPFRLHDRYGRLGDLGEPVIPGVYRISQGMVEVSLPVRRFGPVTLPMSGGAYFRLYPGALFRALARDALERLGHLVTYLHSWEFDPGQPRVREATRFRKLRHYTNLSRTFPRLRALIEMLRARSVRFLTVRQFLEEVPVPC